MTGLNKFIENKTGVKSFGKYNEKNVYSMADTPKSESESNDYANALHSSGYYPAGLKGCFTVGISGGCGIECWVYQKGECECPGEMIERIDNDDDMKKHIELYGEAL